MKPTDPPPPREQASGHAPDAHGHEADELHNEGVAHEHSDVNVRAILTFAAIITVVSITCALLVWGMFGFFERQAAGRDPKLSPLAVPATRMPRATTGSTAFGGPQQQPQLLTDEPAALRQHQQAEEAQLQRYGWVNQAGGVAHVPISDAKKLIVERGLASRPGGADPLLGTYAPARGEAAGGRPVPAPAQGPGAPAAAPHHPAPAPAAPQAPKEPPAHAPSGRPGGA